MGGGDQFLGFCTVQAWQRDFQFDFDAEAIGDLSDADVAINGDVFWQRDLVAGAGRGDSDREVEAPKRNSVSKPGLKGGPGDLKDARLVALRRSSHVRLVPRR